MEKEILEKVYPKAKEIADELNLKLWDIKYFKRNKAKVLLITISREGGTSIKDCEMFSKKIEKFLDENDIIKERYYLEVQSKGIKI
jgi:ribosome maturation factor RimP